MNTSALKAFVVAAQEQSFSRAAEILHLTQPGLSKRIVGLENELKYTLFERLSNGVLLTDAGRLLLPHAEVILQRVDAIKHDLISLEAELAGEVRLGTTQHMALYHLQDALQRYTQSFHNVDLNIDFLSSREAEKKILNGSLDLVCITEPPNKQPQLHYHPIAEERLVFVVSKGHSLNGVETIALEDLGRFKAILPPLSSYTRQYLDQVFGQRDIQLDVTEPSSYLEVLRMVAATGIGWTLMAEKMVDERFYRLPLADFEQRRTLVLVHHRERQLSAPCQALMDELLLK